MRFYEKIFPKNVEMFLFTTSKYDVKTREQWDLKRTKVKIVRYHPVKTMFDLRKFCREKKIERLVNLGAPGAGIPFIIATLFQKTDYLAGYYGTVFKYRVTKTFFQSVKKFLLLPQYLVVSHFAEKLTFTDIESYNKANVLFLIPQNRINYSHAPVDTKLFIPKKSSAARKKLNLPQNKEIVLRVGRINYGKCGDILVNLIEKNPDKFFVLIGEWLEEEIPRRKSNNLLHIDKKSSKELVDYYNASDLCFCLHRHGNGIGITAEESLACGVPVILPDTLTMQDSPAIIKTPISSEQVDKRLKEFFSLPKKERKKITKEAREYAEKYCSDDIWKKEYIKFHLT